MTDIAEAILDWDEEVAFRLAGVLVAGLSSGLPEQEIDAKLAALSVMVKDLAGVAP